MKKLLTLLTLASPVVAEPMLIVDFSDGAESRWRYTSDRVMGGVSDGKASLGREGDISFARLQGTVSTANNGGFIQIRQELAQPFSAQVKGIILRARGNGETYYIHVRPTASRRPWQYYQAAFQSARDWQDVILPWSAFSHQGGLSRDFAPQDILSIGIVANGADYEAALDIDWIGTIEDIDAKASPNF